MLTLQKGNKIDKLKKEKKVNKQIEFWYQNIYLLNLKILAKVL